MPGPIAGVPFLGCCGAAPEFVQRKLFGVRLRNIIATTDQVQLDFLNLKLSEFDMATLSMHQHVIHEYWQTLDSVPIVLNFTLPNSYTADCAGEYNRVVGSNGMQGSKMYVENGPDAFPCRALSRIENFRSVYFDCGYATVPNTEIAVPIITTNDRLQSIRGVSYFFGPNSNKPACCPPSPP